MYLGGFDVEKEAAVAYGIAVIKFRPHDAETRLVTNCPISNYEQGLLHLDEVRSPALATANSFALGICILQVLARLLYCQHSQVLVV